MPKLPNRPQLSHKEYRALAEFRYQLRRYLRHMEENARSNGQHPQQYQLLLAIKGLPAAKAPSVTVLAERMQMNHNSLVELADRCEQKGFIRRIRAAGSDRRQVTLDITPAGEAMMRQQASASRQELMTIGPVLVDSLQRLLRKRKMMNKLSS